MHNLLRGFLEMGHVDKKQISEFYIIMCIEVLSMLTEIFTNTVISKQIDQDM